MNALLEATIRAQITLIHVSESIQHKMATREVNERGEGVISAAIAVMIMAVIGGLMFVAYKTLFEQSETKVRDVIDKVSA